MTVKPPKDGFDDFALEHRRLDRHGAVREGLRSDFVDDAYESLPFVRERDEALEVRVPARGPHRSDNHEREGCLEFRRQFGGHVDGPAGRTRTVEGDEDPLEHGRSISAMGFT